MVREKRERVAAHAAVVTDRHLVADHAGSPALEALRALVRRWRDAGAPRTHQLAARLLPDGAVWHARLSGTA